MPSWISIKILAGFVQWEFWVCFHSLRPLQCPSWRNSHSPHPFGTYHWKEEKTQKDQYISCINYSVDRRQCGYYLSESEVKPRCAQKLLLLSLSKLFLNFSPTEIKMRYFLRNQYTCYFLCVCFHLFIYLVKIVITKKKEFKFYLCVLHYYFNFFPSFQIVP